MSDAGTDAVGAGVPTTNHDNILVLCGDTAQLSAFSAYATSPEW